MNAEFVVFAIAVVGFFAGCMWVSRGDLRRFLGVSAVGIVVLAVVYGILGTSQPHENAPTFDVFVASAMSIVIALVLVGLPFAVVAYLWERRTRARRSVR